jgi:uncharacterized glyoxalase superfamily protein PhnB
MPLLRYRDVAGAIEWLGEAFGFERGSSVTADDGAILYAQLTLDNAMIMVEPIADTAASPAEPSGTENQSCYIIVADADAHYTKARAAGAEIVLDIQDFGQGGRGYSCRDGEGHVWSFGTYDPWHGQAQLPGVPEPQPELQPPPSAPASTGRGSARWAILSGLCATIVTSAVAAAWISGSEPQIKQPPQLVTARPIVADELARERAAREVAERAAQEAETRAVENLGAQEKLAKEAARAAEKAALILAGEQKARAAAEKAAEQTRAELSRERNAKEAAEHAAAELKAQLARQTAEAHTAAERPAASSAKESLAERSTHEAEAAELKEKLAQEQNAREAAERASQDARAQINRERALKDQAWKSVTQLRKQLARAQAIASGADYEGPADPPAASSGSGNTKEGDPQYNGPLSPF